jgi:putative transposase
MKLESNRLYHCYNQGNYQQQLFFSNADYLYFLRRVRLKILPFSDILAYCLMPNHFHFLLQPNEKGIQEFQSGSLITSHFNNGIRILQTGYASYINRLHGKKGSLFKQKCAVKQVEFDQAINYSLNCFHYIHQNAFKAGLCTKMQEWPFCSYADYSGFRNGTLCNQELAIQLLDINKATFIEDSERYLLNGNLGIDLR